MKLFINIILIFYFIYIERAIAYLLIKNFKLFSRSMYKLNCSMFIEIFFFKAVQYLWSLLSLIQRDSEIHSASNKRWHKKKKKSNSMNSYLFLSGYLYFLLKVCYATSTNKAQEQVWCTET